VGTVRNVNAAGVAVDVDIIPAFIAGNRNGLDDVIAGGAGLRSGVGKYRGAEKAGRCECSQAEKSRTFAHSFFYSFCFFRSNDVRYTAEKMNAR
jgi:hypothetical protein